MCANVPDQKITPHSLRQHSAPQHQRPRHDTVSQWMEGLCWLASALEGGWRVREEKQRVHAWMSCRNGHSFMHSQRAASNQIKNRGGRGEERERGRHLEKEKKKNSYCYSSPLFICGIVYTDSGLKLQLSVYTSTHRHKTRKIRRLLYLTPSLQLKQKRSNTTKRPILPLLNCRWVKDYIAKITGDSSINYIAVLHASRYSTTLTV